VEEVEALVSEEGLGQEEELVLEEGELEWAVLELVLAWLDSPWQYCMTWSNR